MSDFRAPWNLQATSFLLENSFAPLTIWVCPAFPNRLLHLPTWRIFIKSELPTRIIRSYTQTVHAITQWHAVFTVLGWQDHIDFTLWAVYSLLSCTRSSKRVTATSSCLLRFTELSSSCLQFFFRELDEIYSTSTNVPSLWSGSHLDAGSCGNHREWVSWPGGKIGDAEDSNCHSQCTFKLC